MRSQLALRGVSSRLWRGVCGQLAVLVALALCSCQSAPEKPAASAETTAPAATQPIEPSAPSAKPAAQATAPSAPAALVAAPTASAASLAARPEYDDLARFLAGLPSGASSFSRLEQTEFWVKHSKRCNDAWRRLERVQLSKIRAWSAVELKAANSEPSAVFYPFAGPDFLYAHAFFPSASDYILVALEPAGSLPDWQSLTEKQWAEYLDGLLVSLDEILALTFFKTEEMTEQFEEKQTSAVLPVLLFFLARTGQETLDLERVYLQPDGAVGDVGDSGKPKAQGTALAARRIRFRTPGSEPRFLYYFSLDLSNYSLRSRPEFTAFLKSHSHIDGFVKAASYLMYRPEFKVVRSLLLDTSDYLVQDDSGIPLEYFEPSRWTLRFFGRYEKPIPLFENRVQPQLAEIYAKPGAAAPLPFGFGYQRRADRSNLMLAKRKRPQD
jgi:hypothetical protein